MVACAYRIRVPLRFDRRNDCFVLSKRHMEVLGLCPRCEVGWALVRTTLKRLYKREHYALIQTDRCEGWRGRFISLSCVL